MQTNDRKKPRPNKKKFALADKEAKGRTDKTDDQMRAADKNMPSGVNTCRVTIHSTEASKDEFSARIVAAVACELQGRRCLC